jgi:replicative DNA helicase
MTAHIDAIDAEAAILGGLLLDPGAFERVGDTLAADDFSHEMHREVYAEIQRQVLAGKVADVVTVGIALRDSVDMQAINALAQYVPSAANVKRYAQLVRERSLSRKLMGIGSQIQMLASDHETPIDARVDQAQGELMKLLSDAPRDEWFGAAEGMALHADVLSDRAEGKTRAMPTGLLDLDEMLDGGLSPGQLVIIGARPSMGKTALGMTIGLQMAADYSVAMLSMEMPHVELRDRMTAMLGRVSLGGVKRPTKGAGLDWGRVVEGIERAKVLNFWVSDQGGLNINQVRSKARTIKRQHGLNVLVVDYIGLMAGLDPKASRAYQLEEISRGLKTLAKELDIAILCLAQVNRKVEERADQMPGLSDLRDSGAIEQDADIVMFVHRPIQARPDIGQEFEHFAKLTVAKNRNGRCGVINLTYIGEQTRFASWAGPAPVAISRAASKGMRDV